MARTCTTVRYSAPWSVVDRIARQYLANEGFREKERRGEMVFKKGTGLATAMQYVKLEYSEREVNVYGWLTMGLGDAEMGEMSLAGVSGAIPKTKLKNRIDTLCSKISSLR